MSATTLKVSVLANGNLLLDGNPVTLAVLVQAMDSQPRESTVVWYYRENAAGEAPPAATEVMKLIVARRLPVRLSSKPDFSDAVTPEAASGMARAFAAIKKRAAERQLVILRPDGRQTVLPAMPKEAASPEGLAAVERLLPSSTQRNVAVIGDTSWTMASTPNLREAARAIPFFGLLMGFASIGHAVWIFDWSTPATLASGARDADLVIVDSARLEAFPPGWKSLLDAGDAVAADPRARPATYQLRKA
jgi:hypothetical protein